MLYLGIHKVIFFICIIYLNLAMSITHARSYGDTINNQAGITSIDGPNDFLKSKNGAFKLTLDGNCRLQIKRADLSRVGQLYAGRKTTEPCVLQFNRDSKRLELYSRLQNKVVWTPPQATYRRRQAPNSVSLVNYSKATTLTLQNNGQLVLKVPHYSNLLLWESKFSSRLKGWKLIKEYETLTAVSNTRCLEINKKERITGGGYNVISRSDCNEKVNQLWASEDNTKIHNPEGYCLEAKGGKGENIIARRCNGSLEQNWIKRGNTITSAFGFCLNANKNNVSSEACQTGLKAQIWTFPKPPQATALKGKNGRCLNIDYSLDMRRLAPSLRYENYNVTASLPCTSKDNQRWVINKDKTITSKRHGRTMYLTAFGITDTSVSAFERKMGDAIYWTVTDKEIKSDLNNQCLDIYFDTPVKSGYDVQTWKKCHGKSNQQWTK